MVALHGGQDKIESLSKNYVMSKSMTNEIKLNFKKKGAYVLSAKVRKNEGQSSSPRFSSFPLSLVPSHSHSLPLPTHRYFPPASTALLSSAPMRHSSLVYPKSTLPSPTNLYSGTSKFKGAGPRRMRPLPS